MKIYCIDNQNGFCKLTVGKEYELINETEDKYIVQTDNGEYKPYEKGRFNISQQETEAIIDKKRNPDEYFKPIHIVLDCIYNENDGYTSVRLKVLDVDQALLGVGDIYDFLKIEPSYNLKVNSSSKYISYNTTSQTLQLGKILNNNFVGIRNVSSNSKAIEFMYRIYKTINEINNKLTLVKKEYKQVYVIEHEPNGKRYYFKSDDELYIQELVHCKTSRGLQYGLVMGIESEPSSKYYTRSECMRIRRDV